MPADAMPRTDAEEVRALREELIRLARASIASGRPMSGGKLRPSPEDFAYVRALKTLRPERMLFLLAEAAHSTGLSVPRLRQAIELLGAELSSPDHPELRGRRNIGWWYTDRLAERIAEHYAALPTPEPGPDARQEGEVVLLRAVVEEAMAHVRALLKDGPAAPGLAHYGARSWLEELPHRLPAAQPEGDPGG